MKTEIQQAYPNSVFGQSSSNILYVADFTERSGRTMDVENHDTLPSAPDGSGAMDCLIVVNPEAVTINYNIFDNHQFKFPGGKDIEHGECCLFPENTDGRIWMAFVEIKDCKAKNISNYKEKVKQQIISSANRFKVAGIIKDSQTLYGIMSFPRRNKVAFNQVIFDDYTEYKQLYKQHKIHFFPTNEVVVESHDKLKMRQ